MYHDYDTVPMKTMGASEKTTSRIVTARSLLRDGINIDRFSLAMKSSAANDIFAPAQLLTDEVSSPAQLSFESFKSLFHQEVTCDCDN
jgi:hypothetical protein